MTPSELLIAFVQGWEQCRLEPYLDDAGHWTVGWGHLLPPSDMRGELTQPQADTLLVDDLNATSRGLSFHVSSDPSQQQWDAMVSLAYNEGVRAIANSTLLAHVNASEWEEAAYQFPKWCYEHRDGQLVMSAGLAKRRMAERAIFTDGDYSGRP